MTLSDSGLTAEQAPDGTPRPSLVVLTGIDAGRTYRLDDGRNLIGRTMECSLLLAEDSVSRKHAEVLIRDGEVLVRDMGSTNGTRVNGVEIGTGAHRLRDGDQIGLSSSVVLKLTWQHPLEEALQRSLYDCAVRDGLTGLYNKRFLIERSEQEFSYATRHDRPLSVLVLDLDHFKAVNDSCGHAAGDSMLAAVAKLVLQTVRSEDVAGRFGGEEFVILMRETVLETAIAVAERIRKGVAGHVMRFEDHEVQVTASIGVATSTEPGVESAKDLFTRADRRLYEAKTAGRNRVQAPRPETSPPAGGPGVPRG